MSDVQVPFGHAMRRHFFFDQNWTNLNHGSYGAYPKSVADARARIAREIELAPDRFLRYDYVPLLDDARQLLADLLHVPVNECVLVPNATTAIDTVLRNLTYQDRDVILYFDTIYPAAEKALWYLKETQPQINLFQVGYGCARRFELPMAHADIGQLFSETMTNLQKDGFNAKLAIFDTISSIPAVRMPFEQLTSICRSSKILSLVDGAHGIGQFPLDLAELDADFFVTNCHKWLFTPRACAVFHVPVRNQHLMRTTLPTSYFFEPQSSSSIKQSADTSPSRFVELFRFIATADNTAFYCIPTALTFRRDVCTGEKLIYDYIRNIAQEGADVIAKVLGTYVMGEHLNGLSNGTHYNQEMSSLRFSSDLRNCALATILLPITVKGAARVAQGSVLEREVAGEHVPLVTDWMQKTLVRDYNTSVSIFAYREKIWTRISGQIYLELSDFEWFANRIQDLCERVRSGEPFLVDRGM